MTIKSALNRACTKLNKANIDSASLDAELLLSFALKKKREYLYAYPEKNLTANQLNQFKKSVGRRAQREPVAYLTKHKEFFGLDFYVDRNVLIPRPETELLVEEVLRQLSTFNFQLSTLIDVGTGSGCIAVSIAKNLSAISHKPLAIRLFAIDASAKALPVARKNARRHGVLSQIKFLKGNLLEPFFHSSLFTIHSSLAIVANLPYLSAKRYSDLPKGIKKYEPRAALVAGPDGLKYYKELLEQLKNNPELNQATKYIILEIDPSQTQKIKALAKKHWPRAKVEIKKDLAGLNRMAVINLNN